MFSRKRHSLSKKGSKPQLDLAYLTLESRQVLNADFEFDGTSLVLDNFVDSDLSLDDFVAINRVGDDLNFVLNDGVWSGNDTSGGVGASISGIGTQTLTVTDAAADLSSITLDDNTTSQFDIVFDAFNFAGDFSITASVDRFGSITQTAAIEISNLNFDVDEVDLNDNNDFDNILGIAVNNATINDIDSIDSIELTTNAGPTSITAGGDIQIENLVVGDLTIIAGGNVTDTSSASIIVSGDANLIASGDVVLGDDSTNSILVNQATTLQGGTIDVGSEGVFESSTVNFNAIGDVSILENGDLSLTGSNTANNLILRSTAVTSDVDATTIDVQADATFVGPDGVFLANHVDDRLTIAGRLSLIGGDLNIGSGGSATAAEVNFIGLNTAISLDSDINANGFNQASNLTLTSTGAIRQFDGATIFAFNATLDAQDEICLDQTTNDFTSVTATGSAIDIVDRNDLLVDGIIAVDSISVRSGADVGELGSLSLQGDLVVDSGSVLLQSDNGISQSVAANIAAENLLVGSSTLSEARSSGAAVELLGSNSVDRLAVEIDNDFIFSNDQHLEIADLNFDSGCVAEAICGLNVVGNVALSIGGSLTQSSAVIASGNFSITADDVCLVFGDCNGDGENDNLFGASVEVIATGEVAIRSQSDLNIEVLEAGSNILIGGDAVVINSDLIASQVVIEANSGASLLGSNQITALELILNGAGLFDLDSSGINTIDQIAGNIDGDLLLDNANDLLITSITVSTPCVDVSESGLRVTSNLNLVIEDGDIDQDANAPVIVGGLTTIEAATGTVCLVDAIANDFNQLLIVNAGNAEIVDANALEVIGAQVTNQLQLQAGNVDAAGLSLTGDINATTVLLQASNGVDQSAGGITATELLLGGDADNERTGVFDLGGNNDVDRIAFSLIGSLHFNDIDDAQLISLTYASVCDAGQSETINLLEANDKVRISANGITLPQSISSTTIFLQSTAGVDQTGGELLTTNLMLSGSGLFNLTSATNDTTNLATSIDGNLNYTDANAIQLQSLDCDAITLDGVRVTGDLVLVTDNGDIDQDANAPVVVGGLTTIDAGTGTVCLVDAVANDFNQLLIVNAGNAEIVDANALEVIGAQVTNQLQLQAGNVDAAGLSLTGEINATSVLLQASNGVDQSAGVITATELLLGGDADNEKTGVFDLGGNNDVDRMAFSLIGSLNFNDIDDVQLISLTYASVCDAGQSETINFLEANDKVRISANGITLPQSISSTTIFLQSTAGVDQTGGELLTTNLMLSGSGLFNLTNATNDTTNLAASIEGNLNYTDANAIQLQSLDCDGITLDGVRVTGDLVLVTDNGDIDQDANAPVIVGGLTTIDAGTGTVCLVDAIANDFNQLLIVNAGNAEIVDANALEVIGAQVTNQLQLQAGNVDAAGLSLTGDINATTVLLQASNGATQSGVITATELMLGGDADNERTGVFDLSGSNDVDRMAFSLIGSLNFNDIDDVQVTSLNFVSVCEASQDESFTQSEASTKFRLTANSIGLDHQISGDTIFLTADAGISQTAGELLTTNLMLSGSGLFNLTSATNDTTNLATSIDGNLNYTDANAIQLQSLDCDGTTLDGVRVTGGLVLVTDNGDVNQDANAPVVVGGLTTIDAGTGTVCLVDAVANDFNQLLIVNAGNAEIVDANALEVIGAQVTNQLQLQAGNVDAAGLSLTGEINATSVLLQASNGVDQSAGVITATELLLGGDADNERTGVFDLGGNNDVDRMAFSLISSLNFNDIDDVQVTSLNFVSVCEASQDESFTQSEASTKFRLTANSIGLDHQISGDTIFLTADAGISQTAGELLTTNLMLSGSGLFNLTSATNDTTNLATSIDGNLNYTDANAIQLQSLDCDAITLDGVRVTGDLVLVTDNGDIDQDANAPVVVGGLTTIDAGTGTVCLVDAVANDFNQLLIVNAGNAEIVDANALEVIGAQVTNQLQLQAGNVDAAGLSLTGEINATSVLLQASNGVDQSAGVITATELLLGGDADNERTGVFDLGGNNDVDRIAFSLIGSLHFNDIDDVQLISLTYASVCDAGQSETINLLEANDKVRISANGITLPQSISSTTIFLQSTAGVDQTGGELLTTNLMLSGSGLFNLTNATNDTTNLAASIEGNLNYTDANAIQLQSLDCDGITLDGVRVTGDLVLVTDNGDIDQDANAPVIVGGLTTIDAGTGTVCLVDAIANDFNQLLIVNAGNAEIVDANALEVIGAQVTNQLQLQAGNVDAAGLSLTGDINATTVLLQASNGATQSGVITATELMLGGDADNERTGVFDLSGSNDVDRMAFSLIGSLNFNDIDDVQVTSLNFVSVCEASQDESFTQSEASTKFRLTANSIGLDHQISADTIFLTADAGISQTAGELLTTNLMLSGSGLFNLTNATNDTTNLATSIDGNLNYTDANAIQLQSLDCDGTTLDGVRVTGGLVLVTDNGDVNQDANAPVVVGGLTTIDAGTGTVCLVDAVANDFNQLLIVNAGNAEIVDANALEVIGAQVTNQLQLQAGNVDATGLSLIGDINATAVLLQASNGVDQSAGVITATELLLGGDADNERTGVFDLGGNNDVDRMAFSLISSLNFNDIDDVQVTSLNFVSVCEASQDESFTQSEASTKFRLTANSIGLDHQISADTIFLTADAGISQTAGELLTTNLMLSGSGLFNLTSATNDTTNLAASIDGNLNYTDANAIQLQSLDCDGITLDGVRVTGDLVLATDNGDVDQDANAPVVVGGLTTIDAGTGTVCLVDAVANDFNQLLIVNAGNAEIVDANALEVIGAQVTNQLQLQAGNVDAAGLSLTGDINATTVLLQASNGATQSGVITATELLLGGDADNERTGVFDLSGNNDVDRMAFSLISSLNFNDIDDVQVTSLNFVSVCEASQDESFTQSEASTKFRLTANSIGLDHQISADTIFLTADAGISQTAGELLTTNLMLSGSGLFNLTNATNDTTNLAASIEGNLNYTDANAIQLQSLDCDAITLDGVRVTGDLVLVTDNGDIDQDANAPVIVGGLTTIDAGTGTVCLVDAVANDFNQLLIVNAGNAEIVDANALEVIGAQVTNQLQLQAGNVDAAGLSLTGEINATSVLLQASNGVDQSAGVITATELLLGGDADNEKTGVFDLGGNNDVDRMAFSLIGSLNFNDIDDVQLISLAYAGVCDAGQSETINLLEANDKVRISANGITLPQSISSTTIFLQSTAGVDQTGGELLTTNLMLSGSGLFNLTSATNDTTNLAASIDGNLNYTDANAIQLQSLDCDGITLDGVRVTGDLVLVTDNGDIDQDANAPVVVGGLTTIDAGTGTVCLIDAVANDINQLLIVNAGNAEVVDANALEVIGAQVTNQLQLQAGNVDAATLSLTGDINATAVLLQASNGATQSGGITATELMLGGDADNERTGGFDLGGNNDVDRMAFSLIGSLHFNDIDDVQLISLAYASVCDAGQSETINLLEANDKVRISANGITLPQSISSTTIFLQSTAGVDQTGGELLTTNLMLSGSGLFNLTSATNDTTNLAASIDGNLNYTDANAIQLQSLDCDEITLDGVRVTGDLILVTDNGDIDQHANAPVVVGGLTTIDAGTGTVCLVDAVANDFNQLLIVNAGNTEIVDANALEVIGAQVTNQLQLQAGNVDTAGLSLTGDINTTAVLLQASNGVDQSAGVITATELMLGGDADNERTGVFDLSGSNDVDRMAFSLIGSLNFNDIDDVQVTSLNFVSVCEASQDESFTQSEASTKFRLTANSIGLDHQISADTIFLTTDAGISQTAGNLQATNLMLSGSGLFNLTSATNDTTNLAASIDGNLNYTDANAIQLQSLDCDGITLDGVRITGDLVLVTDNGDIDQDANAPVVVGGLTTIDAGTGTVCLVDAVANDFNQLLIVNAGNAEIVDANALEVIGAQVTNQLQLQAGNVDAATLSLTGDINATAVLLQASNGVDQSAGGITATELLLGGDADNERTGVFNLSGNNDVDRMAFSLISSLNFNDIDDVQVTSLNFVSVCEASQDESFTQSDASTKLRLTANSIGLDHQISADTIFLTADAGISQTAGNLLATNLMLSGSGLFDLTSTTNDTTNLAASIDGNLNYTDANGITAERLSCDDVTIAGINLAGGLTLTTLAGDLEQTLDAPIVVDGTTTFSVAGNICLNGAADEGSSQANENDFNLITGMANNAIEIADADDITISDLSASRIRIEAGTETLGGIALDGDLTATELAALRSSNGVAQNAGTLSASGLLLNGQGNFWLRNQNQIGSTTDAGEISSSIEGNLDLRNSFSVVLTNLSYTDKRGIAFNNNGLEVDGDATIFSDGAGGDGISDSTTVQVSGDAWFKTTNQSDITLDQLQIEGAIGIETTDGDATLVNASTSGFVFRGDEQPGNASTDANEHFERSRVNGNLRAHATDGPIANQANATVEVTERAELVAGISDAMTDSGFDNRSEIVLGNESNDFISFNQLSTHATAASIQVDSSLMVDNSFIGTWDGVDFESGVFTLSSEGFLQQVEDTLVRSNRVALAASEFIYFGNTEIERISVDASGAVDVTSLGVSPPSDLPTMADDLFAPRFNEIDANYGIVIVNHGDLVISEQTDPLVSRTTAGIISRNGHAFVQTRSTATEAGDIQFDGAASQNRVLANGRDFGIVGQIMTHHAMTAIASGDLTIAENTLLQTTTGSVTDIGVFQTPNGLTELPTTLQGPLMELILPTPDNDPTTRTIGSDNTQNIGLVLGRDGEQNFRVEVSWADTPVDALGNPLPEFFEVIQFADGIGQRQVSVSHVFDPFFLFTVQTLPTGLSVFNDPGINLFDEAGGSDLNQNSIDLNTNQNVVIALSSSRPQGDLTLPSVEIDEPIVSEPVEALAEPVVINVADVFQFEDEAVIEEANLESKIELIYVDDEGKPTTIRLITEEESITPESISKWRNKVDQGVEYPPGKYRLKWTDNGVPFAYDFVKGVDDAPSDDAVENGENPGDAKATEGPPASPTLKDPLTGDSPKLRDPDDSLDVNLLQPSEPEIVAAGVGLAPALATLLTRAGRANTDATKGSASANEAEITVPSFSRLARSKRKIQSFH